MTEKFYYEFISWNPTFDAYVYEDETYYPVFESHLRHFNVVFKDGNGNIYDEQLIAYGQMPDRPSGIPIKDPTVQFYYVFRMWETTTIRVYQDLEINALFYENLQLYEVIFVDEYGNPIDEPQMIAYGTGAVEPESIRIPHKPSTQTHEYAFGGWDIQFSYITQDTVVTTVYVGSLRKFTYTFYLDDQTTIIKHITGSYGDRIIPPNTPTKAGTETYNYIFAGWNKPVAQTLIQNEIYYAVFEEVLKTFTVTFYDGDDNVFERQTVDYGTHATIPVGIPSKTPTIMYQYNFQEWSFDFDTEVKSDIKVYPVFEQTFRMYTVTFIVGSDIYRSIEVEYGDQARVPTPNVLGYDFLGWDESLSPIVKDLTTYALLRAKSYEITFDSGYQDGDIMPVEGSMKTIIADYDELMTLPESMYTRAGYVFIGWRTDDTDYPTFFDRESFRIIDRFDADNLESIVLIATWIAEEYYINYEYNGGFSINPDRYTVEDEIILQSAYKADHKFIGWYKIDNQPEVMFFMDTTHTEIEGELVEVIQRGTIGDITLVARFEYDGFIKLKPESTLGMYYAEITTTIPILEREIYDDDHPVFLLGLFLGQTLENLRENFINNNLVFVDSNQNILEDTQVVATGYQILVYDSDNNVIDRVHIVLKGDTNGDGRITAVDFNSISNHLNQSSLLIASKVLAIDLNNDGRITAVDFNILSNQLNQSSLIHDPNTTSTLRGK